MNNDYIKNIKDCLHGLVDALGYNAGDKTGIELINELVAKTKIDNEVLKIREEECKKLRAQVDACKVWVNKLYGDSVQITADPEVLNHTKTDDHASATSVVFSTPVGYIPINTDLDHLNDLKYIRDICNKLRDNLKDALNEIDSLREELDEARKDLKAAENDRETDSAIISSVYAHFSDGMNMDSEEFQNIVDYCREWI